MKMKKTENPYKGLVSLQQNLAKSAAIQQGVELGKILRPPPEIIVQWNGMELDKRYFYIPKMWVPGSQQREAEGHIVSATQNRAGGGGMAEYASHNHEIDNDYTNTIIYTDTYDVGDIVPMIPILKGLDRQQAQQFILGAPLMRMDGAE